MNYKLMYAIGIVFASLFCIFYAISLSGPHMAMPWLVMAYTVFPFALVVLILAERERRKFHAR